MSTIKVKPWGKDQGAYVVIEEADFDKEKHDLYEEGAAGSDNSKLTKKQLSEKLTELKVVHDAGANKDVLLGLLTEAETKAAENNPPAE